MTDSLPSRVCLQCGADASDSDDAACASCGGPVTAVRTRRNDLVGTSLDGRYILLERLGEGGFGSVYRARHSTVDQIVAVKILRADVEGHPNILQRFYAEARTTAKLKHPNNVRLFDFGHTDDGLVYIAMELVDGVPLHEVRSMPPERAVRILDQVAAALNEAHELGIVHRDLKSANLMVSRIDGDDFVRVLDYGIAKLENSATGLTHSGGFIGTPAYASPEHVVGRTLDRRSDIYAFGVIAFELFAGRRPFTHTDALSLAISHRDDPPPPLSDFATVSDELYRLVMRCLAKDPADRPQTMQDVRDAIQRTDERMRPVPVSDLAPPPTLAHDGHSDDHLPRRSSGTLDTHKGGETAWAETIDSQDPVSGTRIVGLDSGDASFDTGSDLDDAGDEMPQRRGPSPLAFAGLAIAGLVIGVLAVWQLRGGDPPPPTEPEVTEGSVDEAPAPVADLADEGSAEPVAPPARPDNADASRASTAAVTVATGVARETLATTDAVAMLRDAALEAEEAEAREAEAREAEARAAAERRAAAAAAANTTPDPPSEPADDEADDEGDDGRTDLEALINGRADDEGADEPPSPDVDDAEALRELLRNR